MSKVLARIREIGIFHRKNVLIKTAVSVVIISLLASGIVFATYSDDVNKSLADNLIRLHVVANSDSEEDQALKRDVRDIILEYMKDKLKDSKDIEQTKYIINESMPEIEKLAVQEIQRQGKDYKVEVMLGSYPFPTKLYGDIALPAGYYEALRVVIGKGEGANWWCVLFPPLCFVDATHGTVPESVKEELKNVLTEEEYSMVISADADDDIPVKIKFKIVEFFQDSRIKVSGLFDRIIRSIL
ncbi:stage II sporulation protein R [Clostridium thermosuccinogenes]|uniref:Stage II sporulation protein R n=1 Tax=Clostridium thermosuccinogenes TaxID=84032 RepID=A0A2K2FH58_9CLOT|nr:stage II sporulation protein R [Pseudoclostridium thermosuccinogenes]AUS97767.1 stage II sporulation protein R [Pseudoclostridium thermosuccinogenes]PNT98131.1 stage II sporulation protein R [Pseudoclostridium thermosuccinogenes]PNU00102.1 stage II sporulation protein R [Pseudoclostridium thermosuccinogenes]